VAITIDGPAGYYAGGMSDGACSRSGPAGRAEGCLGRLWSLDGNAGNGAAA
jgi:hypothetical protein